MNKLRRKRLVDRLIDAYVSWREACLQVSDAYRSWATAERAEARQTELRRRRNGDGADAVPALHPRRGPVRRSERRRVHQPIEASRRLPVPADVVLRFLADLENHAQLAPGSVSVLSLDSQHHRRTRAVVRLRGPLAIHRTASTELLPPTGSTIVGRAKIGNRTMATVAWRVQTHAAGSDVTLCATVDAAGALDAVLLRLGGRRWLARRFAGAIEHLSQEFVDAPAHLDAARRVA